MRSLQPGSTPRTRNRITNKTRLKIYIGNIEVDPFSFDEDEEKNRLAQRVAGVDQDDANEHHLQQVLSEAALRTQTSPRSGRGAHEKSSYIPTPDSTGIVKDHDKLYPAKTFTTPASYISSSETVEEQLVAGIVHGCTYFMDERDAEWLEKINEEARGEGTSAQAAFSVSARTSGRTMKGKGKEADASSLVSVKEDEFELVMGLFELITHEETEYLHHSLKDGMMFPEFSNYQDTFSNPLEKSFFAAYFVPKDVPPPDKLLSMAQLIYPHWRARRMERGGLRVTPQLNGDETDTLNESFVCFRRRELKLTRKTRASQSNISEKLEVLTSHFADACDLVKKVRQREDLKLRSLRQWHSIWFNRVAMVNMKRKNPWLAGDKGDEKLLVDKEPPPKKPDVRVSRISIKPETLFVAPPARIEPAIRPRERIAKLHTKIDHGMHKRKEKDQQWEDIVENSHVPPLVPFSSRLFKFIAPNAPAWPKQEPEVPERKLVRLRCGRGGRMMLDRRSSHPLTRDTQDTDEETRRLKERWRFDSDDAPPFGQSSEERDRELVDDYGLSYLRHAFHLLSEVDPNLFTDPSIVKYDPENGRKETIIPFKLGLSSIVRPPPMTPSISQRMNGSASSTPPTMNGNIGISRISSNGSTRPGSVAPPNTASSVSSVSHAKSIQHAPAVNGTNGRAAIYLGTTKVESTIHPPPSKTPIQNGVSQLPETNGAGLSVQQMHNLKSLFNVSDGQRPQFVPVVYGGTTGISNMKLPAIRQRPQGSSDTKSNGG
ncbi:enhancer of polycomb-like-domain-containing protein [Desarmillaria tabescens]|uniref:Enhancer of polycomb-like protein n=1 Tax=Armillaria tabescens TaxID=1929756 RepID=A0AA39N770_ARMTA|nr:enhancer of polycomb-like-domain-containing protein [Desarmillaria tabescens]KAK0460039.1 enhancer of polycomb-like-domain-containing protein [Desarmillaria tabescens]